MGDEIKMEIAATGNYGYYYDDDTEQETDDGEWIDIEYERYCERRFDNE